MIAKPLFACLLVAAVTGSRPASVGLEFGTLRPLATPAGPASGEPNLVLGPRGRAYLSWIELAPDSGHVLRFAALEGTRFGTARTIARAAKGQWFVNWADFPSLLPLSDTELVAHWLERSGSGRYAYGVRMARSTDAGRTWSAAVTPHRDSSESEHGFVSLFRVGDDVG